jgi:hypothetical protein
MNMSQVKKLNFNRKVRYLFDNDREPELQQRVVNHYGAFINNTWTLDDCARFDHTLASCGMSVAEFLAAEWGVK